MTMLARKEDEQVLTIEGYEARIALYREQIGTGYIGIGRTLIEAKEAGVVPHGQWEDWVERNTGLTIRQAQRCMQAATEIRDGSAMARLEMSKALLLLSSGLEEEQREEIAEKAADEGATVKALKEEIRQAKLKLVQETGAAAEIREALKKAEAERDEIERQMRSTIEAFKEKSITRTQAYQAGRNDGKKDAEEEARAEIRKEYEGKLSFNHNQLEGVRAQLQEAKEDLQRSERERSRAWDEGFNGAKAEYEKKLREMEQLEAELEKQIRGNVELSEELKAAEAREAKRAAQLEELKKERQARAMAGARGVSAEALGTLDLTAAVREFIGRAGVLPQMGSELAGMSEDDRNAIGLQIETVARWVEGARAAMGTVTGAYTIV